MLRGGKKKRTSIGMLSSVSSTKVWASTAYKASSFHSFLSHMYRFSVFYLSVTKRLFCNRNILGHCGKVQF